MADTGDTGVEPPPEDCGLDVEGGGDCIFGEVEGDGAGRDLHGLRDGGLLITSSYSGGGGYRPRGHVWRGPVEGAAWLGDAVWTLDVGGGGTSAIGEEGRFAFGERLFDGDHATEPVLVVNTEAKYDCCDSVTDGDFTGDGVADMAMQGAVDGGNGWGQGSVYVIDGTRSGELVREEVDARIEEGWGYARYYGWGVTGLGDVDGDGFDDLAVPFEGNLTVFRGPVNGKYSAKDWDAFLDVDSRAEPAGDMDGDGLPEAMLVDSTPDPRRMYLLSLRGEGELSTDAALAALVAEEPWFTSNPSFPQNSYVVGGMDVDGDGRPDVAAKLGSEDDAGLWLAPGPLEGLVTFDPLRDAYIDFPEGYGQFYDVAACDLDQDGVAQLAVGWSSEISGWSRVLLLGYDDLSAAADAR